ncbi:MAG: hypothetical protein EOP17_00255 [Rhizobiaceae bacterium]|nr:MAG: hypothetical protein EOP17_00255 [Rhizobiaceae bacterium]
MSMIRLSSMATLMLLTSCSGRSPTQIAVPPPTDDTTYGRSWTSSERGFLHVASYFTRGQIDDPAWEARRLKKMGQVEICKTGQSVMRRDVRWFPATRITGQECAAVIYTITCDIPTHATVDTLEEDRQEALHGELYEAPKKGCGHLRSGASSRAPNADIRDYLASQSLLVDRSICDFQHPQLDGKIIVLPRTRIGVSIKVEKALAMRMGGPEAVKGLTRDLREDPAGIMEVRLRATGKIGAIFPPDGRVPNDPAHIELSQSVGLGRDGRPYCVQLTARQGDQVWRRTIERSGTAGYAGIGIFRNRERNNEARSLRDEDRDLIEALVTAMGLNPRPKD